MYLWNARGLALALNARRVSEADKAKYLVAGTMVSTLAARPGPGAFASLGGALLSLAALALTAAGIWLCYHANRRGDGTAFLERLVCLTLPVTLRWLALYYAVWIALSIIGDAVGREPRTPSFARWYGLLLFPAFYAMLHHYVAIAALPRGDDTEPRD